ncbi:MAG: DUF485 domain-containing protein [Alphaproteobacteria bacterium]|nr:DUF485 domain-containing protein [Alphaproteobacteria bacterium]MBF0372424.1 DUF485 domain-containing protein [Alphaproteobacteria bacterium]MBF0391671.1 DUF485 domain-containing protein [Alphaproteobacteria bacterium]
MQNEVHKRIVGNAKFAELVSRRSSYAWMLSIVMLVIYYAFIVVVAFWPGLFGTPLVEGSVTTIGFPIGIAVILSAIALTGLYVRRANTEFDDLARKVIEETR